MIVPAAIHMSGPASFAVDSFPNSVITADFNRDGKMDLALAASKSNIDTGYVSVLINCSITGFVPIADQHEQFRIYPNPAYGHFTISSSDKIDKIRIADMPGKTIYQQTLNEKTISLELDKPGIYFIQLHTICVRRAEAEV